MGKIINVFFLVLIMATAVWADARHNWGAGAQEAVVVPAEKDKGADAVIFVNGISQLADDLIGAMPEPDLLIGEMAGTVLVTTFVDVNKLSRTSTFGRYLTEQMLNELQERGLRVVDIRQATSLTVQSGRGVFGLSRQIAEINHEVAAAASLTGTYLRAGNDVLVNARIIDNATSTVVAGTTFVFPLTETIARMLADAASLRTGERGVLYMKQLAAGGLENN